MTDKIENDLFNKNKERLIEENVESLKFKDKLKKKKSANTLSSQKLRIFLLASSVSVLIFLLSFVTMAYSLKTQSELIFELPDKTILSSNSSTNKTRLAEYRYVTNQLLTASTDRMINEFLIKYIPSSVTNKFIYGKDNQNDIILDFYNKYLKTYKVEVINFQKESGILFPIKKSKNSIDELDIQKETTSLISSTIKLYRGNDPETYIYFDLRLVFDKEKKLLNFKYIANTQIKEKKKNMAIIDLLTKETFRHYFSASALKTVKIKKLLYRKIKEFKKVRVLYNNKTVSVVIKFNKEHFLFVIKKQKISKVSRIDDIKKFLSNNFY